MTCWEPQITADGSFTFFSEVFGEAFHSQAGARAEAFSKYAAVTQLTTKAQTTDELPLLDVCYGLGYNTAAALETIWQVNPHCHVTVYGLEWDASVPLGAIAPEILADWSPPVQHVLTQLAQTQEVQQPNLSAQLLIGDARQTIQQLIAQGFTAEAIFFDPFSPQRCPQLWTVEFFQAVATCLAPRGILATYSRAASVRSALRLAGLQIGTIPLPMTDDLRSHEWSQGTIAQWQEMGLTPLSQLEQEHLQTRAAIPYRDPTLTKTAEQIRTHHDQEQKTSTLESTSSWRRRWDIR